jgi:hypothetical protein
MLLALLACHSSPYGNPATLSPADSGEVDDSGNVDDSASPDSNDSDTPPIDSDDTATPSEEAFAAYLTSTTDLCAYEDGETVTFEPDPAPDGYVDPGWPNPYLPCLDGVLFLERRIVDYAPGRYEGAEALATFFDVGTVEQIWLEGEWLDEQDGTDDCGLVRMGRNGLGTDSDEQWLDPGSVSLMSVDDVLPMDRQEGGFVLNWGLDLAKTPVSIDDETLFGLSVVGSKGGGKWGPFDGIELPDMVSLPPSLEVVSPALGAGVELARKDTELLWTETGKGVVDIWLYGETPKRIFQLRCKAIDDGAFTIPASLIDELPAGLDVSLMMVRLEDVWIGTTKGRSFHAMGMAEYSAFDMSVP